MWFRLASAEWETGKHLGAMNVLANAWSVGYNVSGGITKTSGSGSVSKGGTLTAIFTLSTGATFTSATLIPASAGTVTHTVSSSTVTITVKNVSANCTLAVVATGGSSSGGGGNGGTGNTPSGNTATYLLNKNIFSDGLITDQSGPGRLAIVEFFPTNGSQLTVSSSIDTNTIAIRYYKADKSTMASSASDSTYGRVVLVVNLSGTPLSDVYEGQTLTVNGTTYTLQNGAVSDVVVKYELGANIGADGVVQSNYGDAGRIAILHYFETHGTELTAAYSNAAYAESTGIAKRYYDGDKNGGATAATSTYGRLVLYNGTAETAIAENIEGTKITVNGVSYTLSNA